MVSLVALVVALGGTAYASGLISGSQIKNHSIPAKKLTQSAITSLHGQRGPRGPRGPQGPGAISFLKRNVPADGIRHVVTTIDGVNVAYECNTSSVIVALDLRSSSDTLYASGTAAADGTLSPIQGSGPAVESVASTANLDVIAWASSVGTISRFDLGGYANDSDACNIWGLITPGTS
jgi:hypothetical protein